METSLGHRNTSPVDSVTLVRPGRSNPGLQLLPPRAAFRREAFCGPASSCPRRVLARACVCVRVWARACACVRLASHSRVSNPLRVQQSQRVAFVRGGPHIGTVEPHPPGFNSPESSDPRPRARELGLLNDRGLIVTGARHFPASAPTNDVADAATCSARVARTPVAPDRARAWTVRATRGRRGATGWRTRTDHARSPTTARHAP